MELHINRNGENFGPYSIEDVRGYLASGSLLSTDMAWHEGAVGWVPLSQVQAIAPVSSAKVAPPPPPRQPQPPATVPPGQITQIPSQGAGAPIVYVVNNNNNNNNTMPAPMAFPRKSRGTAIVLCLLFGWLGFHRFYTGHTLIGLLYLFTWGFFFIGTLIDLVLLITGSFRDSHGQELA